MGEQIVGRPSCLLIDARASLEGDKIAQQRLAKRIPEGREGAYVIAGCAVCASKFVVEGVGSELDLEVYTDSLGCTEGAIVNDPTVADAKRHDIVGRVVLGTANRQTPILTSGGGWD